MFEQDLDRYIQRTTISIPPSLFYEMNLLFPFSTKAGIAEKMIWLSIEEICKAAPILLRDSYPIGKDPKDPEDPEDTDEKKRRTFSIRPEKMGVTKEVLRQIFNKRPDLVAIAPARLYRVLFLWGFEETMRQREEKAKAGAEKAKIKT